jgi:glycosyltransferase involved in cell wall biosynthesis
MAGYPVIPLPAQRAPAVDDRPTFLFVGAGRHEKGLDLLFEAFHPISHLTGLRIVGRQPDGVRRRLTESHPDIEVVWIDDYVDDETLHAEYARAQFAALPYRRLFGQHGGPSSVLLETLSAGIPIVTTTALEDQLPPGYRGAVVAKADSAGSLTHAVIRALDSREEMARAASEEGPTFVAAHHTFAAYLDKLVRAARLAV